jgi:hypothetical protein
MRKAKDFTPRKVVKPVDNTPTVVGIISPEPEPEVKIEPVIERQD